MIRVPTAAYDTTLDTNLPDTLGEYISVDRRGYAEAVADEMGDDYLSRILIFSPEQEDAPLIHAEASYIPDLVDAVYEQSEMVSYASPEHPLEISITLRESGQEFTPHAYLTDSETTNRLEQAIQVRDTVHELTESDLQETDSIKQLTESARTAQDAFGDLTELTLERDVASVTVPRFTVEREGYRGYRFPAKHGEHTTTVVTSEEARPYTDSMEQQYNIHDGVEAVLDTLVGMEELTVIEQDRGRPDAYGVNGRIRRIGEEYLEQQGIDDLNRPEFYRTLQAHWDDLPAESHHLQDLKQGDFSITSADAAVKLDYLKPESGEAAEILDSIRSIVVDGTFPDADTDADESTVTADATRDTRLSRSSDTKLSNSLLNHIKKPIEYGDTDDRGGTFRFPLPDYRQDMEPSTTDNTLTDDHSDYTRLNDLSDLYNLGDKYRKES